MNFEEGATQYLEYKKDYLKVRSYDKYITLIPTTKNFFGDMDIKEIDTKKLQEFINWLNSEKNYSVASIRQFVMFLKCVCYHFNENKRFNQLNFPKKERSAIKVYTDEEIKKILNYISKQKKGNYLGELIAIYTGMRLGEILALQWKDINFDEDFINVNKSVYDKGGIANTLITSPKSLSSYRKIPLHLKLKNVLKTFKSSCETDFVVGTHKGKKIKFSRSLQRHNEDMCKRIGIECKGMHAYRHYFATHLIKKTNQVKLVSECLGHSSVVITQNVYNNPSLEDKQELMKFLD